MKHINIKGNHIEYDVPEYDSVEDLAGKLSAYYPGASEKYLTNVATLLVGYKN